MGIGEAIGNALAAAGANLILISRSENKLKAISAKFTASYPAQRFSYQAVDIGNHDLVDKAISSAIEELGHIDILINNVSFLYDSLATVWPAVSRSNIEQITDLHVPGWTGSWCSKTVP